MSKYSPTEFIPGCKYYQGVRSPNNAEREVTGVSLAWLHHKGRNKHHYEYWIDYGTGENKEMQGMKIPVKWLAANEFDWKDEEFVMLVRKNSYPENGPNCFERIRDSLPKEDSYIVYSMWIGYLSEDKEDKAIRAFIDGYSWESLHTSGHAYVETIADLIKLVNPKKIIPMHSENPEEFCNIPILEKYRERIQIMEDGVELDI